MYCLTYILMILCVLQAEECLKREKDRVAHYLHSSSEPKLLEVVLDHVTFLQPFGLYSCMELGDLEENDL